MNLIHALILGIVEGITEFLPVSSTAHLEITSRLLGIAQSDFVKSFEIIIQLGAILAVVILYAGVLRKNSELWKRIIVAFIPTGIIGFVLYKLIKQYLLGNYSILVWTLGLGGIILIAFEFFNQDHGRSFDSTSELESMPYSTALMIGLVQALAVIPGVSRSAATIITGRALGVSRKAIVEFSFLLAIPTMLAATGYDLLKNFSGFSTSEFSVLGVGFIAAFFSALLAVKLFMSLIKRRGFTAFGIYRIILAIIIFKIF